MLLQKRSLRQEPEFISTCKEKNSFAGINCQKQFQNKTNMFRKIHAIPFFAMIRKIAEITKNKKQRNKNVNSVVVSHLIIFCDD